MKTIRIITTSILLSIGGCAVTGSFEIPTEHGTARITSDGKTTHVAIVLPRGYSK
jgi:hypothetical protein